MIISMIFFQFGCGSFALAQQINIRSYSIEDGLVNNDLLSIRQDSRVFIWLCTRGGLSRYDGIRFTNYPPTLLPKFPAFITQRIDRKTEAEVIWYSGCRITKENREEWKVEFNSDRYF